MSRHSDDAFRLNSYVRRSAGSEPVRVPDAANALDLTPERVRRLAKSTRGLLLTRADRVAVEWGAEPPPHALVLGLIWAACIGAVLWFGSRS